ncbi:hypothetical protein [Rhizobacter sp. LjRoot28]|uniref:hypothetical protein n=1 Tax=Rhizobacter sp. LjRoot28 TaxID=3342309 RepID=UPI003ECD7D7A
MSYYVLGIAEGPLGEDLSPLSNQTRVPPRARFLEGYLNEIAPAFQEFSDREEDILGLHSFASISPDQVERAKTICERLRVSLSARPDSWRVRLGTIKFPGQAERPFEPLVVRRRALALIDRIERLLDSAQKSGASLVFAGGAWYVPLCGIKLPPGTVRYS